MKQQYLEAMPAAEAQRSWLERDFTCEAVRQGDFGIVSLAFRPHGISNVLKIYAGVIPRDAKSGPEGDSMQKVWDMSDVSGFAVVYSNDQAHSLEVDDRPQVIDPSTPQTLHRLQRLTLDTTISGPEQHYTVTRTGFLYIAENVGNAALSECLRQIHDTVFVKKKI